MVDEQKKVPWAESNSDNVQLHYGRDDLEDDSQGGWSGWMDNIVNFLLVNWIGTVHVEHLITELVDVTCGVLARVGTGWLSHVVVLDTV